MRQLQEHLRGIVKTKGGELEEARSESERLSRELEKYKLKGQRDVKEAREAVRMEEQARAKAMVEEAKHQLDEDTRKTLKKMVKERKFLKERNSVLEMELTNIKRELKENSVTASSMKQVIKRVVPGAQRFLRCSYPAFS